ncbi:MAG: TetR family transcriptional regulator [Mycobacterium sp.]|jgi:AcrR family transcriptional regulator|nr:TetR family transcriptional regulator [Mycobacterium sp.]
MATEASTAQQRGRAEVERRLVAAAIELFSRRGPDGVSLREIASAAGVNYGLIHQYIGSKEDLLRLAFRSVSERTAERFAAAPDVDGALDELFPPRPQPSQYVTMLAWAILQGHDPQAFLGRSPALATLFERLAGAGEPSMEARVKVAEAIAMNLGWQLFGAFISGAVGLDPDAAGERDNARRQQTKELLRGEPSTPTA